MNTGVEDTRETKATNVAIISLLIEPAVARTLAGVFRSLSDPTRLRIISALSQSEFCVNDLAAALEMGQSTISHQLRDMRHLGLVSRRRQGRNAIYRLHDPHVRNLFAQGLAHIQDRQPEDDRPYLAGNIWEPVHCSPPGRGYRD